MITEFNSSLLSVSGVEGITQCTAHDRFPLKVKAGSWCFRNEGTSKLLLGFIFWDFFNHLWFSNINLVIQSMKPISVESSFKGVLITALVKF